MRTAPAPGGSRLVAAPTLDRRPAPLHAKRAEREHVDARWRVAVVDERGMQRRGLRLDRRAGLGEEGELLRLLVLPSSGSECARDVFGRQVEQLQVAGAE